MLFEGFERFKWDQERCIVREGVGTLKTKNTRV